MAFHEELPIAAAASKLAIAIYHARAEAFGIAIEDWRELDIHARHELVDRAAELLHELRPAPRRSFDYMGLVIGAITPAAPFGETRTR